ADGSAFRVMRAAWRTDSELFAEVELPSGPTEAERYLLHPALLDAALHTLGIDAAQGVRDGETDGVAVPHVPFRFGSVALHAAGAPALRVRIGATADEAAGGGAVSVQACDVTGAPVLDIGSLALGALPDAAALDPVGAALPLHRVAWTEIAPGSLTPSAVALVGPARAWAAPLRAAATAVREHADLTAAAGDGAEVTITALTPTGAGDDPVSAVHTAARETLASLRA